MLWYQLPPLNRPQRPRCPQSLMCPKVCRRVLCVVPASGPWPRIYPPIRLPSRRGQYTWQTLTSSSATAYIPPTAVPGPPFSACEKPHTSNLVQLAPLLAGTALLLQLLLLVPLQCSVEMASLILLLLPPLLPQA